MSYVINNYSKICWRKSPSKAFQWWFNERTVDRKQTVCSNTQFKGPSCRFCFCCSWEGKLHYMHPFILLPVTCFGGDLKYFSVWNLMKYIGIIYSVDKPACGWFWQFFSVFIPVKHPFLTSLKMILKWDQNLSQFHTSVLMNHILLN